MPDDYTKLENDAVLTVPGPTRTGGEDGVYTEISHDSSLELETGTIAMTFSADRTPGEYALISKDSYGYDSGGFTLWLKDGMLQLTMETDSGREYLSVPNLTVTPGEVHQVAITFGPDGLELWYDGELVGVETDFVTGIDGNSDDLIIGGTRAWDSDPNSTPDSLFQGEVGEVLIFDEQLGQDEMFTIFEEADQAQSDAAMMAQMMADLNPVFGQMHHASDALKGIADQFGISEHGHLMKDIALVQGRGNVSGTDGADGLLGSLGADTLEGESGADFLQGSYGNDQMDGGKGADVLDGGHGEDTLKGGKGNDLLISRADAREPDIAFDPDRDEGDPYGELTDGKLYPDQPIPGDDKLIGGKGADIFYFQTLINAKERYIAEHTGDDGIVNWHGVAGENDKLHDHWVDAIGNDVIWDFNRAEGDRIVIEGHTTEIRSITYGDSNNDGVMDKSIISIYSDQGSGGGAHNQDELGTITVYGDLITELDVEHTAAPAYGIVASYQDLEEALEPLKVSEDTGKIGKPGDLNDMTPGYAPTGPAILAAPGTMYFDRDERTEMVFDHKAKMKIDEGTVALSFNVDEFDGTMALFTKDANGQDSSGHLAAYLYEDGTLKVRLQDTESSWYHTTIGAIDRGRDYDLAVTFGADGFTVFLNGVRVAYDAEVTHGWGENTEQLVFGAAGWSSTPGTTDNLHSHLSGTISDIAVYDTQLDADELYGGKTWDSVFEVHENSKNVNLAWGSDGALQIITDEETLVVPVDAEFVEMNDATFRVRDLQVGTSRDESMEGGDGADFIEGKAGNDVIWGQDNDDRLYAGHGQNTVYAGDGDDYVAAGKHADKLYGGDGRDTMKGGDGYDTLSGEDGRDELNGGDGDDNLYGGTGHDTLEGGDGYDRLQGDDGNDHFYGGLGDDYLYGQSYSDAGKAGSSDTAYFDGDFADFSFSVRTSYNSSRGVDMETLTVTDSADGGSDGYYEGSDKLIDIDVLVFADQTVLVDDLVL